MVRWIPEHGYFVFDKRPRYGKYAWVYRKLADVFGLECLRVYPASNYGFDHKVAIVKKTQHGEKGSVIYLSKEIGIDKVLNINDEPASLDILIAKIKKRFEDDDDRP